MGGTSHDKALEIEHYNNIVVNWCVMYIECNSMVDQTEMAKGNCDDLSHGTFFLDFLDFCTICILTFVF
jgi:hypothetical protein